MMFIDKEAPGFRVGLLSLNSVSSGVGRVEIRLSVWEGGVWL